MSRRTKLILAGIGIVVIAVVVFFVLINPIRGDISALKVQIDDENTKIAAAQRELDMAESTRTEGRENEARLMELAKMIPGASEVPSLIIQIQDLADKAGIKWMQVSPSEGDFIEGLDYGIIPLSCSFSGSFYDVSDFIYRTEQMAAGPGRLLTVKDITFSPEAVKGGGAVPLSVVLSVRMTLYAFVMAVPTADASAPATSEAAGAESTTTTVTE